MPLDYSLLQKVKQQFVKKQAFVPMPGGQQEPVAGASPMTAALAAGGMGGQPPMNPSMMGGQPPMDPSMMGP